LVGRVFDTFGLGFGVDLANKFLWREIEVVAIQAVVNVTQTAGPTVIVVPDYVCK
jgi:hypothetical protein